jgi:hypothetical protein
VKRIFLLCVVLIQAINVGGQEPPPSIDSIGNCFSLLEKLTAQHKDLWGVDLYGPLLIVEPSTRRVFANVPDSAGILQKKGDLFTGVLPPEVMIANTSLQWSGRRWAMVLLPLSQKPDDQINLLTHELFHLHQPSLGFMPNEVTNAHLEEQNGRVYLRLELSALLEAIQSVDARERNAHIKNALRFRTYRYTLYPKAQGEENTLEMNEGLAEYTGVMMADRNHAAAISHFELFCHRFFNSPSYTRSFAYHTIPMYGYLLKDLRKYWNRDLKASTSLTQYLKEAFGFSDDAMNVEDTLLIMQPYDGSQILASETERSERIKKQLAAYRKRFTMEPRIVIPLMKMQVSFDPGNIVPIDGLGTYYPDLRITDQWGILTVTSGALIGSNWDKVLISLPFKYDSNIIIGEGWRLELNEGYHLLKDGESGNFKVGK